MEKLTGFKSGNFGLHFGLFEKRPSGLILESNKARYYFWVVLKIKWLLFSNI